MSRRTCPTAVVFQFAPEKREERKEKSQSDTGTRSLSVYVSQPQWMSGKCVTRTAVTGSQSCKISCGSLAWVLSSPTILHMKI
ncbi:hypothetical protein BaRGS_00029736 [Batillaria attramentaria]|uniref:Uncharacterized protein n=1 Tax=Batillaria attramentaria TaxID=370345 RepID=A0ABD0JWJ8_9CAEN